MVSLVSRLEMDDLWNWRSKTREFYVLLSIYTGFGAIKPQVRWRSLYFQAEKWLEREAERLPRCSTEIKNERK